jgi:hypothetical protein
MIFVLLLSILGVVIDTFAFLLGGLGWNFPTPIANAIVVFLGVLHTFAPFLPFIPVIIVIALILVPAHVIRYIFEIMLWLWSLVPWIGTRTTVPGSSITTTRNFGMKTWESRTKHPDSFKETIHQKKKRGQG